MSFIRQPVNQKKARKIVSFVEKKGFKLRSTDYKEVFIFVDRERGFRFYLYTFKEDGRVIIINVNNDYLPFIDSLHHFEGYSRVYIDEGAARALLRGADLMAPGILEMEKFEKEMYVVVRYKDTDMAIGKSLYSSEEIETMERGKVIKVIHYKGDKMWKTIKNYVK